MIENVKSKIFAKVNFSLNLLTNTRLQLITIFQPRKRIRNVITYRSKIRLMLRSCHNARFSILKR